MILSPSDYTRSFPKNNIWIYIFILSSVFIFIFSSSYASPGRFQAPVQDTIPEKRFIGRLLYLDHRSRLTGTSVVSLRAGSGVVSYFAGIFFVGARPGDRIRFSFAGKV